jgi:hypothetical protein
MSKQEKIEHLVQIIEKIIDSRFEMLNSKQSFDTKRTIKIKETIYQPAISELKILLDKLFS